MTTITGSAVVSAALLCVALLLAAYRKLVARREDDILHVGDFESALVARQQAVAARPGTYARFNRGDMTAAV